MLGPVPARKEMAVTTIRKRSVSVNGFSCERKGKSSSVATATTETAAR